MSQHALHGQLKQLRESIEDRLEGIDLKLDNIHNRLGYLENIDSNLATMHQHLARLVQIAESEQTRRTAPLSR